MCGIFLILEDPTIRVFQNLTARWEKLERCSQGLRGPLLHGNSQGLQDQVPQAPAPGQLENGAAPGCQHSQVIK